MYPRLNIASDQLSGELMQCDWLHKVFSSGICTVIDLDFRRNLIIKVAVDPRGESRVDPQTTLTIL